MTAVYVSTDIEGGELETDGIESRDVQFFNLCNLPEGLNDEYRSYIKPFLKL